MTKAARVRGQQQAGCGPGVAAVLPLRCTTPRPSLHAYLAQTMQSHSFTASPAELPAVRATDLSLAGKAPSPLLSISPAYPENQKHPVSF